jgi:hypothetical protein
VLSSIAKMLVRCASAVSCTVLTADCEECNYGAKILVSSFYSHLFSGPPSLLFSWDWETNWPERETYNLPLCTAYMTGEKLFLLWYTLQQFCIVVNRFVDWRLV